LDVFPNGEKVYTTVQTYLERLVDKGIVEKEKDLDEIRKLLYKREKNKKWKHSFVGLLMSCMM